MKPGKALLLTYALSMAYFTAVYAIYVRSTLP